MEGHRNRLCKEYDTEMSPRRRPPPIHGAQMVNDFESTPLWISLFGSLSFRSPASNLSFRRCRSTFPPRPAFRRASPSGTSLARSRSWRRGSHWHRSTRTGRVQREDSGPLVRASAACSTRPPIFQSRRIPRLILLMHSPSTG